MTPTQTESERLRSLPLNRFHPRDSTPPIIVDLSSPVVQKPPAKLRIAPEVLEAIASRSREGIAWSLSDLARMPSVTLLTIERIGRSSLRYDGTRLAITDVRPRSGRIMSAKPFDLVIELAKCKGVRPVLASVVVQWAGEQFVVEQEIKDNDVENGLFLVHFGKGQTLPPGPAVFLVTVFDVEGGQSCFRTSCAVLPSNPVSLHISPRTDFVTGSVSARGVREAGDVFRTRIRLTINNGNDGAVTIDRAMSWEFWDGGVGGTLVESGTHDWGSNFAVSGNSTWSGWLTFTSPGGSGIYNRYDDKEDMTMKIGFVSTGGQSITDTITARVMVGFGMNVTRVGAESFTSQEYSDLYDAVDVTQEIYEARDVTYTGISRRHIKNADIGGYDVIDSLTESHDLFEDWSGPDNDYIDVFIVHGHTTGFDGLAGSVPGPTSHAGRNSGVWASKTGYVDASGNKRLHINYLGMLIGHEVGHYLGLPHSSLSGNLMLSNSGTNDIDLVYDQYRLIIDYGWVFVV